MIELLIFLYVVIFLLFPSGAGIFYGLVESFDYSRILTNRRDPYDEFTFIAEYRRFYRRRQLAIQDMRAKLNVLGKLLHYPTTVVFIVVFRFWVAWPIWIAKGLRGMGLAYIWLFHSRVRIDE